MRKYKRYAFQVVASRKDVTYRGLSVKKRAFIEDNQAQVVQTLERTFHRINYYPAGKYYRKQLLFTGYRKVYPAESVIHLFNNWGQLYEKFTPPTSTVRKP